MASIDTKKILQENSSFSNKQNQWTSQSLLTRFVQKDDRKKLSTIQYKDKNNLSKDALINIQKEKAIRKKSQEFEVSNGKSINIYVDPKSEADDKTFDNKAVQTEGKAEQKSVEDEAFELMVNEEVPESYWKELAEQRRQALDDSLHENEQLHKEIEELQEENDKLSEMAGQADYFAEVIQTLLVDNDDGKEEVDNPEKTTANNLKENMENHPSEEESSETVESDKTTDDLGDEECVKANVDAEEGKSDSAIATSS